ncbi:MAG TPA: DUF433 domain-containing protein [Anaerolineales bacterium]|nr:DUF433 domain-containing protein [Anaerolineales bacterium]
MATGTFSATLPLKMDKDGVIRVSKTRVTLDTIVAAFLEGLTAEEITAQYPVISWADVYSVVGYYLHPKKKMDAYLKRREKLAAQIRTQNESRFNTSEIRTRLLARKKNGQT